MRHGKSGKKFGRSSTHRKAMFRNMVTSLLSHERIVTTEVKAKEIARLTEKMITLGKRGDLHARRQAVAFIRTNEAVKKLFTEYQARYADRQGGYTRILKLEPRPGDNAPMAIVELVDRPIEKSKEKSPKSKEKPKATKADEKKAAAKEPAKKMAGKKEKEEKEESPKKKAPAKKADAEKKESKPKAKPRAKKETKAEEKNSSAGEKKDK